MKKGSGYIRWAGIALLLLGLLMVFGLFPVFYCFGISTIFGCAGLNINLGFWFGVVVLLAGVVLIMRRRRGIARGRVSAVLLFALLLISFGAIYQPQGNAPNGSTVIPSPLFWFGLVLFAIAAVMFLRGRKR